MESFTFALAGLPDQARVVAFQGTEALSTAYEFTVDLVAPHDHSEFDLEAVIGASATLRIMAADGSARATIHGRVESAEFVHAVGLHALYRVVLRPKLRDLAYGMHSRVWVDQTFPAILEAVLKANGLASDEYEITLSKTYASLQHVCQYHESDFDFISRWMEREGIYYFFKQGDDKEKLVVTDDLRVHESLPEAAIPFVPVGADDTTAGEAMYSFRSRRDMVGASVAVADYDYLKPSLAIAATAPIAGDGTHGVVSMFGLNLPTPADATRIAGVRAEASLARQLVFAGRGRVYELRPGYKFRLQDHPVSSLDAEYLTTELRHRGLDRGHLGEFAAWIHPDGLSGTGVYSIDVIAIASTVAFRPALKTPVPRIWGLEPARVDGPAASDYSQIDDHGRYHVKILFDESGLADGKASSWIRMLQPHGGAPEGFHFPLRKNTEVMLAFVGGDPDRPVIVGVAPDGQTESAVTKANHTQNVIMTGGENRIEIEDQAGDQYIQMYSPPQKTSFHLGAHKGPYHHGHNVAISTDGNGLIHTGGERNVTVGGVQTEDVQGALTETYHAAQTTHVHGAFKETIDGGATQTISAGETRTVTGGVTETISGGETRTVNGGQTESVNGSLTRNVSASVTDTISASVTRNVSAAQTETISGALSQTITGGLNITTPATMNVTAAGGVTFNAAGGFTITAPGGIKTVDGEFWAHGGVNNEAYGMGITVGIGQTEADGLAQEHNGMKIDLTLLKFEAVSVHNDDEPVEIESVGEAIVMGLANILSGGLICYM